MQFVQGTMRVYITLYPLLTVPITYQACGACRTIYFITLLAGIWEGLYFPPTRTNLMTVCEVVLVLQKW